VWRDSWRPGLQLKDTGSYPFTDTEDFEDNRLAFWGVVPARKFNPNATVTYGEESNYGTRLPSGNVNIVPEGVNIVNAEPIWFGG